MNTEERDPGLDTPLDLDGETLFVNEVGHWVKFIAKRTGVILNDHMDSAIR